MPKIRFRSESAETCWILAKQIYFAGLILLLLFPLICLLMPTGSVGEFEVKLALIFGYAAVGIALPVYLVLGVVVRCIVSIVTSKNLADDTALPENRNQTPEYRAKVRRIRGITAGVCAALFLILSFVPYRTVRFEEGWIQTCAIAYTSIDWNDGTDRDVYFFPLNHKSIGYLKDLRK
ncbi:MAG: hypothetical protein IJX93_04485 [Clostridia bacterium]|nr:hypothetical protein [Clostridia bacterium]